MCTSQLRFLAIILPAFVISTPTYSQATRTWVSGLGDDANPCSLTAPCKTFAGAISKTAEGGEISVLSPGGYGVVTITKSITISGEGTLASTLSSGVNGITVNAGNNAVVTIRNISVNGAGTGIDGIRYLSGKSLIIDRVTISGCTGSGVNIKSSSSQANAFLHNVFISNVEGAAVVLDGTTAQVNIDGASIAHNLVGVQTLNGAIARISNVFFTGNTTAIVNNGTVISFGNNRFAGNGAKRTGAPVQMEKEE